LEAFYGPMIADAPFKPTRDIAGFRTGAQGMGHTLVAVQDIEAARAFYCDLLGFRSPAAHIFLHPASGTRLLGPPKHFNRGSRPNFILALHKTIHAPPFPLG
jgi:hypothetical protein